jgi:hypothetical protein
LAASDVFTKYRKNKPYEGREDEPTADSISLSLDEGVPIYRLWLAPPVKVEHDCLKGPWTHFALLPTDQFPGGLPMFVFRNGKDSLVVRAPVFATEEQVKTWASTDSNVVMFLLIERGSRVLRQIRTVGLPTELRQRLATEWRAVPHPVEPVRCQQLIASMNDEAALLAADVWEFKGETFRQIRRAA